MKPNKSQKYILAMWAPLPLPIAILVFVLFAWKLLSMRKKSNEGSENTKESTFSKFNELSHEEKSQRIDNECADVMAPIIARHQQHTSEVFNCIVSSSKRARHSHMIDVGSRLKLRLVNGEVRVYSIYGGANSFGDIGDFLDTILVPRTSPVWTRLEENHSMDAYLSRRPYHAMTRENYDSFDVMVFYKT